MCIVALAVALPACGGSGGSSEAAPTVDETVAAVDGLTGTARTNELVKLAEEQGSELNLYTSSTTDYMTDLTDAFSDAHDIDVSIYKTASEALVQRIVEEDRAGFHGSDVDGVEHALDDRARRERPPRPLRLAEGGQAHCGVGWQELDRRQGEYLHCRLEHGSRAEG